LLVKEFAGGSHGELIFDWQHTGAENSIETRLGILTHWVISAEASGKPYGLRLPNREFETSSGEQHKRQCLEALALFPT
jgi:uncharacterized protein (DUF58 family)